MVHKFYLHNAELVLCITTILCLEEVELAGGRLCHLHDTAEGILILAGALEADGDLVGLHALGGCQMDVAEAALCLAAPDELFAGIDLQGIAAQTPAGEFEADVIDDSLLTEAIGNPSCGESTVVFPLGEFVVIEAASSVLAVIAGLGRSDGNAAGLLGVGRSERCLATKE